MVWLLTKSFSWMPGTYVRIYTSPAKRLALEHARLLPMTRKLMDQLLKIDGKDEFVIYLAAVGKVD